MVVTHAIVIPLADIGDVRDLAECLALLPSDPGQRSNLAPATLAIATTIADRLPDTAGTRVPGLFALARALLAVRDESVVWIAPPSFEPALVALWRSLWPEVRRSLSFRLSFGPADAGAGGPSIVTAPAATTPRWPKSRLVSAYSDEPPLTAAEAVLVGDGSGGALLEYWRAAEALPVRIRDLRLLESALQYTQTNDGAFESAGALVRLVAVLSPTPAGGGNVKREAVGRLAEAIRGARAEEVGSIRNLDLGPFSGAEDVLRGAMEQWMAASLEKPGAPANSLVQVISDALGGDGPPWWVQGVFAAIRHMLQAGNDSRFEVGWAMAIARPEQGVQWLDELPADHVTESGLIAACPAVLPPEVVERAARLAAARKWERLHAGLAVRAFSPGVAIRRHFEAFDVPSREGIEHLVRGIGSKAVVEAALGGVDALVPYAGKALAGDLRLAAGITPSDSRARGVWLAAIEAGAPAHLGLASPDALIDGLISALRSHQFVDGRLLVAVAREGSGNLYLSKERRDTWQLVPSPAREILLASTADAWLASVLAASRVQGTVAEFDSSVESELQSAIVTRQRMRLLATEDVISRDVALTLFRAFPSTPENVVDDWTERVTARRLLSQEQASALASLIGTRMWRRAAGTMFRAAEDAPVYRAAAHAVRQLVSKWDRLKMLLWGHEGVASTADDPWESLIDLAMSLYAWGPGDRDIWERAGGDFARLEMGKTGEESWRKAIGTLRKGGGGNVSAESLLRAMHGEFMQNRQVQLLLENIHWFRLD
jgi:hypothetical protein